MSCFPTHTRGRDTQFARPGRLVSVASRGLLLAASLSWTANAGCAGEASEPSDDGSADHGGSAGSGGKGNQPVGVGGESVLPDPGGVAGAGDGEAGQAAFGGAPQQSSHYALSSITFTTEGSTTYVSLLDSLDVPHVDFDSAREFSGTADIWVHDGALYVSELETLTITRFSLSDGQLVEGPRLSFANYGLTDFGFWLNTFVAADKAYFLNGAGEYVIWDPQAMEIIGSIALPELAPRASLEAFPAYADRSTLVRDGLLYQPFYYTDDSFFAYDPASSIVVIDIETDQVVDVLDAPCPGIDFATRDDDDNLYFSSWVYAPGAAAVLDQPTTCVAKLAAGSDTPSKLFDLPALTAGREGGAFRYLGDGKALMSVLHDEHSTASDVSEIAFGGNWQFWLYDLASDSAIQVDNFDWNAGAAYDVRLSGEPHMLVPSADYASTRLFAIDTNGGARPRLESQGWSLRLFGLD